MTPFPNEFIVPLIHIEETNSTNSYLQACINESRPEEFTTVVANFQTAGRGQRGNSWESERGSNLLFSFVLYPEFLEARRQFFISQIVSLAIKEALECHATDISIKWPNDIYWKDKKICGILIENDLMGKYINQSIAGIGININQQTFVSPAPNPVSLKQITNKEYSLSDVLNSIMRRVKAYYQLLRQGDTELISQRYEQALFRKDGMHRYRDSQGEFTAQIVRVEPEGRLILKDETQIERGYMFKEVEYLLK